MRSVYARSILCMGIAFALQSEVTAQQVAQPDAFQGVLFNPTSHHRHRAPTWVAPPAPIVVQPAQPIPAAPVESKPLPTPSPKTDMPSTTPTPSPEAPVSFPSLTSAALGDSSVAMSYNPTMFGDLMTTSRIRRTIIVNPNSNATPIRRQVLVTRASAGSFKISDNESPRPQDRFYVTYNYFSGIDNGPGNPSSDLHRETLGLEKTFLDRNASVGIRVPFIQSSNSFGGLQDGQVGDVSLYTKFALINDRDTGDVLSVGFLITLPTGDAIRDDQGRDYHTTLYQPFVGWIRNFNRDFFAQGFHSVIASNYADDVTAAGNDIAIGYWLYRNDEGSGLLRGIIPTIEGHLFTPLNHRNDNGTILASDIFTLTAGVTFRLGDRSSLGFAGAVPLTGPKPNDAEGIVTFNFRY